jgi:hypothetical protein
VLEEKVGSNTAKRYVWSPVYVDAMILRDRDTDGNGTLDERLWVQQDANWNVTALVNGSGIVVERYAYDTYGAVTVYDASYTVRGGGSNYGWNILWQGMRFDPISASYKSRGRTDISPTLGRPFQLDPLRFGAGDVNLYRWEANAPSGNLDPSGLDNWFSRRWEGAKRTVKSGINVISGVIGGAAGGAIVTGGNPAGIIVGGIAGGISAYAADMGPGPSFTVGGVIGAGSGWVGYTIWSWWKGPPPTNPYGAGGAISSGPGSGKSFGIGPNGPGLFLPVIIYIPQLFENEYGSEMV